MVLYDYLLFQIGKRGKSKKNVKCRHFLKITNKELLNWRRLCAPNPQSQKFIVNITVSLMRKSLLKYPFSSWMIVKKRIDTFEIFLFSAYLDLF